VGEVGGVFVVGAAALLAGAVLLARVRVESRVSLAAEEESETLTRMVTDGFRAVVHTDNAPLVVGLIVAQAFVGGLLTVLIGVAAFEVFDGGAAQVGYLTAAVGAGGLIGALGAMTLGGRRLAVPFGLSLVFWGIPIALMAPQTLFAPAIVL